MCFRMHALSLALHSQYLEQNSAKALPIQCCSYHNVRSQFLIDVFIFNILHNEPPLISRRNETPATEPTFHVRNLFLSYQNNELGAF